MNRKKPKSKYKTRNTQHESHQKALPVNLPGKNAKKPVILEPTPNISPLISQNLLTQLPKIDIVQKMEARPISRMQQNPQNEFLKTLKRLTYRHRTWDVWRDFVTMFACAISNSLDKVHYDEREKLYLQIISKYNKNEQMLFPELVAQTVMALDENPEQDFLGNIFMNLDLGDDRKAQIFTPYNVCSMMAAMIMGDDAVSIVKKKGCLTIHDPCCGAGTTLIAGIHEAKRQLEKENYNFQNHVFVVGQDIDFTVALMSYIQISLLGVAGFIKVGNSLTEPISTSDTKENYWITPMSFSNVWITRHIVKEMELLLKEKREE